MKDEDYFEYLTELRDSGSINMMEAPLWLQDEYEMSKAEARRIFIAWTESFKQSA